MSHKIHTKPQPIMNGFEKLGRHVAHMIAQVNLTETDAAYSRQPITYNGGEVVLLILKDAKLADMFDKVVADNTTVKVNDLDKPAEPSGGVN